MGAQTPLKIYAHRGLHHGNPEKENSRGAVKAALNSSANGLEVDLQPLFDADFLLHHDDARRSTTTNQPNLISRLTITEVRERFGSELVNLRELLDWDWQDKRFIFECKSSRNNQAVARRLRSVLNQSPVGGSFTLSTSDLELLRTLLLTTGFTIAPVIYELNPLIKTIISQHNPSEIHLKHTLCTEEVFQTLPGIEPDNVIAWTVNSDNRRQKLERLGIKGIMTDNSDFLP